MNSFRDYLFSKGQSTTTVALRERAVYDFCNWSENENLDAKDASYGDLLLYIKGLQKRDIKQRTIQIQVGSLSHYFKWLVTIDYRKDIPTQGIEIKGVQRKFLYHILPMVELERVYEKMQGNDAFLSGKYRIWDKQSHYSQKQYKVMFGLMIWQGLGASEINRLTLTDLKLREGKLIVAGDRRSNERTLKLESVQILDLMEYLHDTRPYYTKDHKRQSELLFVTIHEDATTNNRMTLLIQLVHRLHPPITNSKQVRASVITHWLKNYNLREAQYMAGHRYVSSTESYLVNDMEGLLEDINKFHPMGQS